MDNSAQFSPSTSVTRGEIATEFQIAQGSHRHLMEIMTKSGKGYRCEHRGSYARQFEVRSCQRGAENVGDAFII